MDDVNERVAQLEAELAELKSLVAGRREIAERPSPSISEEVNRRAMLRRGGLIIAGAAAGGAALAATATPAAAVDGLAITQGAVHTGLLTTTIRTTSTNQTLEVEGRANLLTIASNGPAPLRIGQQFSSTNKPLATGWGNTGSLATIVRSDNGADLWYAHAGADKATGSNPQVWGRVQTSVNSNYLQFLPLPARALDTRVAPNTILADNSTNTYTLSTAPADAVGAMGTITLVDASAPGSFLSIYAGDQTAPSPINFSNVNANPGNNAATAFVVSLPTTKQIKVYAFKSCHVIIDIAAWVVTGPKT